MKTPGVLILLTIFVTYVVGFNYWDSEKAAQKQKRQVATSRAEPLYGNSNIDDSSTLESTVIGGEEPVRLNMFQFITNSGCYFYEHGPWFPYLNDFITAELRVQLSNWCAKYTNIVGESYKKN